MAQEQITMERAAWAAMLGCAGGLHIADRYSNSLGRNDFHALTGQINDLESQIEDLSSTRTILDENSTGNNRETLAQLDQEIAIRETSATSLETDRGALDYSPEEAFVPTLGIVAGSMMAAVGLMTAVRYGFRKHRKDRQANDQTTTVEV